jgi:uncharacterized protein (DUF433 family)
VRALHQVVSRAPGVRQGTAVFAATKIPVKALVDHLDRGGTPEEFNRKYPQVSRDLLQAACALGLETLIATTPLEPVVEQASLLPRTDPGGTILNGEELNASLVVGRKVRCPACRTLIFKSWPEGWDAHAAQRCRGLPATGAAARKAEFKRRYQHLFR